MLVNGRLQKTMRNFDRLKKMRAILTQTEQDQVSKIEMESVVRLPNTDERPITKYLS
jgi:hypothetical protein